MSHHEFMHHALDLVTGLSSLVSPNPRVGCVIVQQGRIVGAGTTQSPGGNHAEVEALEDAKRRGEDVRGATVYVTLEPCAHHGRTAPCADALIRAGVGTVVAAMTDPDPRVSGEGFKRLVAAGIDVISGVLEQEARELNPGFLSRIERGRPWVRIKIAASLDGRTALPNGQSQWITSEEARRDGHRWRARADAILTGIGTVQKDDPRLTVRDVEVNTQPKRIVVDSHLRMDSRAQVLQGGGAWVFCSAVDPEKRKALEFAGAEVIIMPGENGQVDLIALMKELGRRDINELHVEAGAILNGALIQAGCVDELIVYMAPALLGKGLDMADLPPFALLDETIQLRFHEVKKTGPDLRIVARLT